MSTNVQSSLDGNPRFLCFLRHILKHLEWKIYQTDYKRAVVLPAVPVTVGEPHHDEQEHEEEEEGARHSVDQSRGHRHRHRVSAGLGHPQVMVTSHPCHAAVVTVYSHVSVSPCPCYCPMRSLLTKCSVHFYPRELPSSLELFLPHH